jgi:hypothetical protein
MGGPTVEQISIGGVLLQFEKVGLDPVGTGDSYFLIHIHREHRTRRGCDITGRGRQRAATPDILKSTGGQSI